MKSTECLILQHKCVGKIYRDEPSEIQKIMNVQLALDALKTDGVRLINIGEPTKFLIFKHCKFEYQFPWMVLSHRLGNWYTV